MLLHYTQLTLSTADVDVDRSQVLFFHNREPDKENKVNMTCYQSIKTSNSDPRD